MSKLYSISIKYAVIEEHQVRADSLEEAEEQVLEAAEAGELMSGNIYDSEMDSAELYSSREATEND